MNDLYYLEASSPQGGAPAVGGTFSPGPLYANSGALSPSTWSHLAATYDGATLRLYVNGSQVDEWAQTGPIQTSTGPLSFGGDALYGQFFSGRIDEVRIYNRALSASDVQAAVNTPVNFAPAAANDSATLAEGDSVLIDLAANDSDPEGALNPGSIQIASGPAHGSIATHGDGSVTYTHDGGETTSDAFSYTIRDVPGTPSNAATVSLTIVPANDAPIAAADSASVLEGGAVLIGLAANDTDPEGALNLGSIQIASPPAHGSIQSFAGGVIYTHDGSETTSDAFSYTIRDLPGAQSNVAAVALTVIPVNDAPVAVADAASVVRGASVQIGLAANDTDAEGPLNLGSIQIASSPQHGTVQILGGGNVRYTHDGSETASDSFTYTIRDAAGTPSNAGTVSLTIVPAPEIPALNPLGALALAAALLSAGRRLPRGRRERAASAEGARSEPQASGDQS